MRYSFFSVIAASLVTLLFLPVEPAAAQMLIGYGDEKGAWEPETPASEKLEVVETTGTLSPEAASSETEQPVDLVADTLQHDDKNQLITAAGNVELRQGDRTLQADRIFYDLKTDTVKAVGNIVLVEPTGDVHYAEEVILNDEMKEGFVVSLHSMLADGGRFQAVSGSREGDVITMYDASYTPCDCAEDPERPGWQVKADKVVYDQADNRISYENARFEILGVPVAWTPYLSHPDGTVDQKSGLLTPRIGFDSQLGFKTATQYYWAIAPHKDLTFGTLLTTKEAPVGLAEYRQRFSNAAIEVSGSTTYSSRTDSVAGTDVKRGEEWRGHLFSEGRWDIDDKWRAGMDLEVASDDQYLRQYDFSSKDVLENELYVERFSGRNYAVGRLLAFQDVRIREEQSDQPNALPEIEISMIGQPNQVLGGRWALDLSMLQLERLGNDPDMSRIVGQGGWQGRYITDFGLVNTVQASVRGDMYYARDREVALPDSGRSGEGSETRLFPRMHAVSAYPLVKPLETYQAVIEPTIGLTLSPNINDTDSSIPNEDSQDVQLDASNLFEPNRFPGKDRIEDGSHVTYGLRSGLYGYDGSYADVFVGQSYRFDNENPFPVGSGLSDSESDYVGQVSAVYEDRFGLNYRFQIGSEEFTSRRHELDTFAQWDSVRLSTRYLFAKALEGTDIDESREQLENALSFDVTDNWRLRTGALHDLGEDPGLRKAILGIDYFGCCISLSATAQRNLTTDASGDSGTEVTLRLGLKNLGEFSTAGSDGFQNSTGSGW